MDLEKLAGLIATVPDGKLKEDFTQLYARLELSEIAARNVETRLIRTNWRVADALERQAREVKSSARDVIFLKAGIKAAIAALRER